MSFRASARRPRDRAGAGGLPATVTPKVSVVVPVYNPGELIDGCLRSLLDQSLPAGEYELIFVDDGSTDTTPARLDALARDHDHVHVRHIPNSGWPGRPRNIGLEMARGEFVLFMDNDDWLEPEALERMHALGVRDGADIVLGKVIGHGKPVPPTLFTENRSGVGLEWAPLAWLLTPHRLFRRAFVERHGLQFPEGRRRLEDHVFVLGALFRTKRVSVLAEYPCYHWVLHDRQSSASAEEFDPTVYYRNLQEVLDVVDEHTEAGALRDRLYTRWYRGKVLSRVGGWLFLNRSPEARRARFEEIRSLVGARFPAQLDAHLPFSLRVRSQLVRSGTVEQLERLAELETQLKPSAVATDLRIAGAQVDLELDVTVDDPGELLTFATGENGGATWRPPPQLASGLPEACLEASDAFDAGEVHLLLRATKQDEEFLIPTTARTRLIPDPRVAGQVRVAMNVEARIDTRSAATGRPLAPGRYVARLALHIAGFRFSTVVPRRRRGARLVLAIDAQGHASVARANWKQWLAARVPGLRALVVRAKRVLRRRR